MKFTVHDAVNVFHKKYKNVKPEYKFHKKRKWLADYLIDFGLLKKIIVECDGGLFVNGRHSRGAGMLKDMEKYNEMAIMGFILLRYAPSQGAECLADLQRISGWK